MRDAEDRDIVSGFGWGGGGQNKNNRRLWRRRRRRRRSEVLLAPRGWGFRGGVSLLPRKCLLI